MKTSTRLSLLTAVLFLSAFSITAQERAKPTADAPIDFNRARELMQKQRSGAKLSPEEDAYLQKAMEVRRSGAARAEARPALSATNRVGFKPLTEMTADDRYKGQDGGLYGGGRNTPPEAHRRAAEAELAKIQPLDAAGKPDKEGVIGFVSISMSNATQEFSTLKRRADADSAKSPRVTIVDCAQGGQAMAEWVDPEERPWQEAMRRLAAAQVTDKQVQVAWVKLANKGPRGDLIEHGKKLERDTMAVLQNASKFATGLSVEPNLRRLCQQSAQSRTICLRNGIRLPLAYSKPNQGRSRLELRSEPRRNQSTTASVGALLLGGWHDATKRRRADLESRGSCRRRNSSFELRPRKSCGNAAGVFQTRPTRAILVCQSKSIVAISTEPRTARALLADVICPAHHVSG
jgi:hypothetical protein